MAAALALVPVVRMDRGSVECHPRSVSMTPEMWAMIDRMRGHSSRGVYLAAILHKKWNAEHDGCQPST